MSRKRDLNNLIRFQRISKKQGFILLAIICLVLLFGTRIIHHSKEDIKQGAVRFPKVAEREIPDEPRPKIEPPNEEKVSLAKCVSGTFVDAFSGAAWLDGDFTNLYFEYRGRDLIFPPKIKIREILPPDGMLDTFIPEAVWSEEENIYFLGKHRISGKTKEIVWKVKENKWEMREGLAQETMPKIKKGASGYRGEVEKQGEKWRFAVYKGEKKILEKESKYKGNLNIGQCGENVLVVFSSYFSQAFEISPQGEAKDLTKFFGWRVSEWGEKIYEGFPCYLKNADGSIIRWDGQEVVEISKFFKLTYQPDFLEMVKFGKEWYLVCGVPDGGTKVYRFFDNGFYLENPRQAVSKKVNFDVSEIVAAVIKEVDFKGEAKFGFYLSNNGGKNWQKAEAGKVVYFKNSGNDLRWAVRITPLKKDSLQSPYLTSIFIRYWYKRD